MLIFVNTFHVHGEPEEFERIFADTSGFMTRKDGYRRHRLVRVNGEAERYLNIAEWDDEAALRSAVADPLFEPHVRAMREHATSESLLCEVVQEYPGVNTGHRPHRISGKETSMPETVDEQVDATSVIETMTDFHSGLRIGHMLSAVAELGIADELADGVLGVEELARRTNTHGDSLYRVLRALASKGVFSEVSRRTFGLTPLAETLCSDAERSMRDVFRLQGKPFMRDAYGALEHTIRTGEPSFEHVNGATLFEYLADKPDMTRLFSKAMGNGARQVQRAAVAAYEFGDITRLVDIGGAHGHLIAMILDRHPEMSAVLFDQPHVVSGAEDFLTATGHRDRIEVVGGNYYDAVPAGGDGYVMSHVLHQMNDEEALVVLQNVRSVLTDDARLVIIDPILPEGDVPHPGKFMDITMLALTRGLDRTEQELRELLAKADLRLTETVAMSAPSSIAVVRAGGQA